MEDDVSLRLAIETFLTRHGGYAVTTVGNTEAAKSKLKKNKFNMILSDVKMPGGSGYDLLEFVKSDKTLETPVFVLMTAYGTIEQSVQAIKQGAYDVIVKPFELTTLEAMIKTAFTDQASVSQLPKEDSQKIFQQSATVNGDKEFITKNPTILDLLDNLKKVASSKAAVLIQGESGTGKEVLANMIHQFSPRRNKPFIAINCAAMPDSLLESELFGHEKGSFTGAIQRQIGKFELSNEGTILLDEISEMSLNMQTKLLRVLQEYEVYRIGGSKAIPLNLRIITSTNRDLYSYMKAGNFREDLYYRINVIPINVPPLRERGDDVIILAEHFLNEFSEIHGRPSLKLDELARYKIMNYPWYGNVRELRNAMERAVLVRNFEQIINENLIEDHGKLDRVSTVTDLPVKKSSIDLSVDMTLDEVEKRVIFETLRRYDGNRTKTAEKLGISLRTLRNKLKTFREEELQPSLADQS